MNVEFPRIGLALAEVAPSRHAQLTAEFVAELDHPGLGLLAYVVHGVGSYENVDRRLGVEPGYRRAADVLDRDDQMTDRLPYSRRLQLVAPRPSGIVGCDLHALHLVAPA